LIPPIGEDKGIKVIMEKFGKICKEYMVREIADRFKSYPNFFITSFSNVGVGEMEELRKSLKQDVSAYMVTKNTMLKQAIKKSGIHARIEDFETSISGTCGVLFTKGDPTAMSRLLMDFSKSHDKVKIRIGFVNGETISADTIKFMSTLPSREVLLSMTLAGMKSPVTGFVGILRNLLSNLVSVVDAIGKKKTGN
jgi:large subunit ribosomal protein L10